MVKIHSEWQRTWAISGVDLHLDLEGPRVRAALEAALRDAVSSGRLGPGRRLPSSRALAADLGIARNTVAEAYGQLVAEGWLTARQGSGTRVAERPEATEPARRRRSAPGAGSATTCVPARPTSRPFRARPGFARPHARSSRRRSPRSTTRDPRGRPELRAALADYLARARGASARAPTGSSCAPASRTASRLLCQALRAARRADARDRGATACPTVPAAASAAGLDLSCLAVDDGGRRRRGARRRRRRRAHAGPPVPARSAPRPASAGSVVQWAHERRAPDHRGRLRRRVPLRPPSGRSASGARARPCGVRRNGEQDARARPPARLARRSRRARRDVAAAKTLAERQHRRDRSAHAGGADPFGRVRPARPALAPGLPPAPGPVGGRAASARAPGARSRASPLACTRWSIYRPVCPRRRS